MGLFKELKRRNVFKVGIAYIISAWVLMQFVDLVLDNINAPDWVMQVFMLALAIGFPLVLLFAWAFELTPEGIKKEKNVDRSQSIRSTTGRKLDRSIIVILILALSYFMYDKFSSDSDATAVQKNKAQAVVKAAEPADSLQINAQSIAQSIAVLPFINMSADSANEYFSDGLSEELLNLLAKVPKLKVAARTSSFQFKGQTGDIAAIAKQLNVANVLEGSVRKSGNQVRITAQLIKADDGYHLWSETYDRSLENIFAVQDEIAAAVVDALKIALLGAPAPVTREADPEAYALYLQGRYWYNLSSRENSIKSVDAYQRAISIDPNYAAAWTGLATATLHRAGQGWIDLDSGVKKAREAAQRAVDLEPKLALGWVSLARIAGEYTWHWKAADKYMQKALALEPNSSEVQAAAASLAGQLGQFDRAVSLYRQASATDPLNQRVMQALADILETAGHLQEAEKVVRHLYTLNPEYGAIHSSLSWILLRQGNATQALAEAEQEADEFWGGLVKYLCLYSLERYTEADSELATLEEKFHQFGAYQIADAYAWGKQPEQAFKWLNIAYNQHDPGMSSLLRDSLLFSLHADPRWEPLLEKIGLLDAWNKMPAKYKGVR